MGRIVTMLIGNVKACFFILKSFAEIFRILSLIPTQSVLFHTFRALDEDISTASGL